MGLPCNSIDNTDDIIDSRDVIARIDWLEGTDDEDELEELAKLKELADDAGASPDWQDGEALIRDDHFEDYAKQLAEDIGAVDSSAGWPNNCIDWAQAAELLQQDYMLVSFDGEDYWIRA